MSAVTFFSQQSVRQTPFYPHNLQNIIQPTIQCREKHPTEVENKYMLPIVETRHTFSPYRTKKEKVIKTEDNKAEICLNSAFFIS
jgi:hypothetical protein